MPVVTYVNSSAEVKAESDICVTSANAVAVVRSLGAERILFAPDRNLGSWVARSLPDVDVILWDGWCPTHDDVTAEQVAAARAAHPPPRSSRIPSVVPRSSTSPTPCCPPRRCSRMRRPATLASSWSITEAGLIHALEKAAPGKRFYELNPRMLCPNMKVTTLPKVRDCLADLAARSSSPRTIRVRALGAVERMVAIG